MNKQLLLITSITFLSMLPSSARALQKAESMSRKEASLVAFEAQLTGIETQLSQAENVDHIKAAVLRLITDTKHLIENLKEHTEQS